MNICLIGPNGFLANAIGSYCNLQQYKITAIGRRPSTVYHADVFLPLQLTINGFPFDQCRDSDIIFYTAAKGGQSGDQVSDEETFHVNTWFPVIFFEKLKTLGFKGTFISFGSYFEIGNNNENKYFSEEEIISSILPVPNNYCVSKRLLTRYFSSVTQPCRFFHFLLPTIYGEREQTKRLLPYLIGSISSGQTINLTSGDQVRQYIYVADVVSLLFNSVQSIERSGIYNFLSAETLSVRCVAKKIFNFFHVIMEEEIFGSASRSDVNMKVLQLDSSNFNRYCNPAHLHKIENIIPRYINNEL